MMPPDREETAKLIEEASGFDASIDDGEPTSEELVEMLKQAIREVNEGKTRPIDELLCEVDETLRADANGN